MELNDVEKRILVERAKAAKARYEILEEQRDEIQDELENIQAKLEESREQYLALKHHL